MITDKPERRLSIALALEQVVMSEFERSAGIPGPDLHVHREHTDCFYVLDGELTLSLTDGDHVVGPGTFVLVPPNLVHTFRCDTGVTRFLNFHAPGLGFDRYLQGELEGAFDQHTPPEDGGADPATLLVRTAATDAVQVMDIRIGFLADADDTLDAMGLVEYTAPPGFAGPPAHFHEHTWDAYYVLEGELDLTIGDDRLHLRTGDAAAAHPGTVHGFANGSATTPTRFLDIHAPGGFERYFREVAAAFAAGQRDPDVLAEITSRYDMHAV